MLKLCRVDLKRSKEVFEGIERYKKRVIRNLNPAAIVLFGSFARGDIHEGSDVDMIVIANFKEGFLDRIKTLLDLNVGLPLEPIGYTPEEFKKMREQGNSFIVDVLDEGRVIHGVVP